MMQVSAPVPPRSGMRLLTLLSAFGGTLSSYTWISMIINFIQSRNPPILPALHQRPHSKTPRKDGQESEFADDIESLRGFGKENEETLGELLFNFFKFYGHEFDYDTLVISVRSGKQISKIEKKWHLGNNNMLCVEEPFNTSRNLGNTADETSFRGLHMELRRAFDLVSAAKLDECCEQYEFPKEEKPPHRERQTAKSKPAIIRSASQSQSSRGGRGGTHRGGRHSSQRGNNNSRRASSATFDNHPGYLPGALPANLASQDTWLQQQAQAQLHNDLFQTYSVLQAQENNLRLQLYSQSQAYMQAQAQNQSQTFSPSQTRGNGGPVQQQATDRNRTNSFDQSPLTAPIRPELYYYPLHYSATPVYGYQTPSTNPSSPSMSATVPELRRSMHRSSITSTSGAQASSSMRSHSQPAARSAPLPLSLQGAGTVNPGLGPYTQYRQSNGVLIPNFIADENSESGFETPSESFAATPPEDATPREYVGYYVNGSAASATRTEPTAPMAIPTFGDIQQGRRRLSTEQLPQSILDRLRRPSRSPSPLGHDRSYSTGAHSAPLTTVPSQQCVSNGNLRTLNNQVPLVVNGSNVPAPISIPHWQASVSEVSSSEDHSIESAGGSMDSSSRLSGAGSELSLDHDLSGQHTPRDLHLERRMDPPLVVNGSNLGKLESTSSFASPPVVNGTSSLQLSPSNGFSRPEQGNSSHLSPAPRNRPARQAQNGGVSPLDIGFGLNENQRDDTPHLSPVYEARTPSPITSRKFESAMDTKHNGSAINIREQTPEVSKLGSKLNGIQVKQASVDSKTNGHTRAAKSEGSSFGNWQKIPKNKKKGPAAELKGVAQGLAHGEKLPNDDSERKGG